VGLKYGFAKDASVQFRYKFLTQQDGTSPANTGITSFGDFTATLGTAELQFKF
ncbi:MAG: hypothetical protein HYU64_05315, partial [Armatimonadetes bacterium]|nr:hypothetical protein [Armatimonadota bacterium]